MGRPAGALKVKVLGCAVGQRAALHRVEAAGGNRRVGRLVADPERRINRGGGIADQFQVTRAGGRQVRREVGAKRGAGHYLVVQADQFPGSVCGGCGDAVELKLLAGGCVDPISGQLVARIQCAGDRGRPGCIQDDRHAIDRQGTAQDQTLLQGFDLQSPPGPGPTRD